MAIGFSQTRNEIHVLVKGATDSVKVMEWVFVTASFGDKKFHQAAERLISQANSMALFTRFVHITEENLLHFAPKVSESYGEFLRPNCKGYGYYSWKPEALATVLQTYPNAGLMYADAGCEINSKFLARLRLRLMMERSRNACFFHALKYPELEFTKTKILQHFQLSEEDCWSGQFQATWFLLSGELGKRITEEWSATCLLGIEMVDDTLGAESPKFIENRHDQSVLSCLLKSMRIKPRNHRPCYKPVSWSSKVRCYLHPIWSARNRSGESIQK
jgi:hypothetical protein